MSAGNRYLSVICLFLTFHFFKAIDSFFYASDLRVRCHGLPWFLGRRGRAAVPGVDAASEHGAPSVTRLCHRRGRRPSGWRPSPGLSQRVTVPLGTSETGPAHTVGEAGLRAPDGCTGPAVALRLSPGLARPEGAAAAVPMLGAHRDRLIVHPAARPRRAAGFQWPRSHVPERPLQGLSVGGAARVRPASDGDPGAASGLETGWPPRAVMPSLTSTEATQNPHGD